MLDLKNLDLSNPIDRQALADTLCEILKKLDAIPAGATAPATSETSGAVSGHIPTIWPLIGGENFEPVSPPIFSSNAFRDLFIPGGLVRVYGAGCPGLRHLATVLDVPLRKIGATETPDIRVRINDCSHDAYGNLARTPEGFRPEPGFDNFVPVLLPCSPPPSPFSPVKVEPRAIAVRLPSGMTFEHFETRLHRKLENVALSEWIKTPQGQTHLSLLGAKAESAERYTSYAYGAVEQPSVAKEFYIFRPRKDGARLVSVIERLILEFLGLSE